MKSFNQRFVLCTKSPDFGKGTVITIMDNFMDKLAQKFSAQEIIKANSQAEAAEMKKLQLQVAEYEKILQEMRKLNYKNAELSDKIESMVGENASKIKDLQDDELKILSIMKNLSEEQIRAHEEDISRKETDAKLQEEALTAAEEEALEKAKKNKEELEELFRRSDEYVHKENVKVYRNVQAVVVEELKAQTAALFQENKKLRSRVTVAAAFSIITMIFVLAGIVMELLQMLQIFGF